MSQEQAVGGRIRKPREAWRLDQFTLGQPGLPRLGPGEELALRGSLAWQVQALLRDPVGVDLIRNLAARADDPAEARAVNRYAAAISMPRVMMRGLVAKNRPSRWPELYRLAERFDVTISVLKVRLAQLGLLPATACTPLTPRRPGS